MLRFLILTILNCGILVPARAQSAAAPVDYARLINEGLELYQANQNAEALARFQQALQIKPNDFRAEYAMALVYYTTGRYAESADLCQRLVARGDDKLPNVYVTYGTALDRQQKSAEAVQIYQQALRKYPAYGPLWHYQSIAQYNLKQPEEAMRSIQRAVQFEPASSTNHIMLAQLAADRRDRILALLAVGRGMLLTDKPNRDGTLQLLQFSKLLWELTTATDPALTNGFAAAENQIRQAALKKQTVRKPDEPRKINAEIVAEKLTALLEALPTVETSQRQGFAWTYYAPYYAALLSKGYVPVLAYLLEARKANAALAVTDWLAANAVQVQAFRAWSAAYQWPQ